MPSSHEINNLIPNKDPYWKGIPVTFSLSYVAWKMGLGCLAASFPLCASHIHNYYTGI
jgi:hypothetical protein